MCFDDVERENKKCWLGGCLSIYKIKIYKNGRELDEKCV